MKYFSGSEAFKIMVMGLGFGLIVGGIAAFTNSDKLAPLYEIAGTAITLGGGAMRSNDPKD